jgi:hypothetical protein
MNRSILIVICDFLLVSLLVFSTPDLSKVNDEGAEATVPKSQVTTNAPASSGQDLAAVMRTALNEEQQKREQLIGELQRTRQTAAQQLSENQRNFEQQQAALQQQISAAQSNATKLNSQLETRTAEANASQQQLASLQTDIKEQNDQAAALKKQLASLEKANQAAQADKERLTNQLQIAYIEQKHATEQAAKAEEQVVYERAEKARAQQQAAKLAEGVTTLATNSSQLAQEIRENRPLASNTIFNDFVTNAVAEQFVASKPGFFGGESTKERGAKTVLVTDGTNIFAACHVQDTPLTFWIPPTDWQGLTGVLARDGGAVNLKSLAFSAVDPRIMLMPVSLADAKQLGGKIYRLSSDPFKFQDAVVVGAQEDYYGECKFQIDVKTPDYVKLDHGFFKGLFGKFNPSRGDLVFSRTGEVLGIMANNSYCLVFHKFNPTASIALGQDMRKQYLADTLSRFYVAVTRMPGELQ